MEKWDKSLKQNTSVNKSEYVHPHGGLKTIALNSTIPRYINLFTRFCPISGEILRELSFIVHVSDVEVVRCRYKSCGKHDLFDHYKKCAFVKRQPLCVYDYYRHRLLLHVQRTSNSHF